MERQEQEHFKQLVFQKINDDDYVHQVFLKPIELALKSQGQVGDVIIGELPCGIRQAVKANSIMDNCYELQDFKEIEPADTLKNLEDNSKDNLISYLKGRPSEDLNGKGIELAICVCMYSENKQMLKDSIKGIQDNIIRLITTGVDPDSIAVFVIMDGIEKVDETISEYFEELERESHIYLGPNNVPSYTVEDIEMERQEKDQKSYSSMFVEKNINSFLFSQPELDDREERRFDSIRKQYFQLKKIKNELQKLKTSNVNDSLYEKLPQRVRKQFFNRQALEYQKRQQKKKGNNIRDEQLMIHFQRIIDEYAYNPQKSKLIATEAISKALVHIDKFMATRENLLYLASFRKKIHLPAYESLQREETLIEERENATRHMNLFMCVKYKNAGKLSSHNWFFNGFCKELNPNYTILMDVGLKPEKQSIFMMYQHMKRNPKVGGVCGYMRLKIEQLDDEEEIGDDEVDWLSSFTLNFVDIQKAQQMEYNFAHIIDKPFESAFRFIHVLPGAFSGYNMKALISKDSKDKLLKAYFKSIEEKMVENNIKVTDITLTSIILRIFLPEFLYNIFYGVEPESQQEMLYNENIFFAEDRILCMEIHKNGLHLVYLPDAIAEVDPIKTVHGLMGQRKRWINGSYFAFEKVKKEIGTTDQCELILRLQVLFFDFLNIFIYFAPAIFFFTIHISMMAFQIDVLQKVLQPIQASSKTNNQMLKFFVYTIDLIYAMILMAILYYSLTTTSNKPIFKPIIYFTSTVLGLLSLAVFIVFLVDIVRGLTTGTTFLITEGNNNESSIFRLLLQINRWTVVGIFGFYIVPLLVYGLLFRSAWPIVQSIKGAFSYIFYSPTYFIILSFYALCRIDDISWGTKGLNSQNSKQSRMQQTWKLIKLTHVGKYVFWNIVGSVLLLSFAQDKHSRFYIAFAIMLSIVFTTGSKIIVGSFYMLLYKLCNSSCCRTYENTQPKKSALNNLISSYRSQLNNNIGSRIRCFNGEMNEHRRTGGSFILTLNKMKNNRELLKKEEDRFRESAATRSIIAKKNSRIHELPKLRAIAQK